MWELETGKKEKVKSRTKVELQKQVDATGIITSRGGLLQRGLVHGRGVRAWGGVTCGTYKNQNSKLTSTSTTENIMNNTIGPSSYITTQQEFC